MGLEDVWVLRFHGGNAQSRRGIRIGGLLLLMLLLQHLLLEDQGTGVLSHRRGVLWTRRVSVLAGVHVGYVRVTRVVSGGLLRSHVGVRLLHRLLLLLMLQLLVLKSGRGHIVGFRRRVQSRWGRGGTRIRFSSSRSSSSLVGSTMTEKEKQGESNHDQSTGDASSNGSDIGAALATVVAIVAASAVRGLGTAARGGRGGQGCGLDQSGTGPNGGHGVETVEGGGQ